MRSAKPQPQARGVFVLINLKLLYEEDSERNGDNDSYRVLVVIMISARSVERGRHYQYPLEPTVTGDTRQGLRDTAGAKFRVVFVVAD